MREVVDSRVLAGFTLEDASTGAIIRRPLALRASGARFTSNLSHVYAVVEAPALEAHIHAFDDPPSLPPEGSVSLPVEVRDSAGEYLPRTFRLDLPRSQDPASPTSIFSPVAIPLFRSPKASRSIHWAVVYARLEDGARGEPLPAALVRVRLQADDSILALGMPVFREGGSTPGPSSARAAPFSERILGQAAIPIVGIPTTVWGSGTTDPVIQELVPATFEVVPISAEEVSAGPPDPDVHLFTPALPENRWPVQVASGRRINLGTLAVTVP